MSPTDAHLEHWLRLSASQATRRLGRALAAEGVTVAEWVLLRDLFDAGALPPSAVAARLRLTRGAVTKLVDRLRVKRLVVRAFAAGDRRYQAIALTGAGAKLVPVLAAIADATDAAVFGALSTEERSRLEAILRKLALAQPLPAGDPLD